MRQKTYILFAIIFLFVLLIGLNAVSYVQKEKIPDTEESPNRSTYNVGATGTRAFYDLLAETRGNVMRWQETFPKSDYLDPTEFSTFVIIGSTRKPFEPDEINRILDWVSYGGKLVIIDRFPNTELISTTADWAISQQPSENSTFTVDPANQTQMVGKTIAVKPVQPTLYTAEVNAVQPSKFATSISIKRLSTEDEEPTPPPQVSTDSAVSNGDLKATPPPPPPIAKDSGSGGGFGTGRGDSSDTSTSSPTPTDQIVRTNVPPTEDSDEYIYQTAPVIHLANEEANLLIDIPYGDGQIVFLSDPYIVANSGIRLVDNAQLATNIVASDTGTIAFDEYHQGYGSGENRLFEYFTGTPVMPIILQILVLIILLFYSQSRRFARALPDDQPNRLSKLEYVSAMAQLQGRTKAFDLAIENIYTDFRRRVSRLFAVDNHTSTRKELAEKIAERLNRNANDIEEIMFKCEDIMHGERTNKKEIVQLTSQIRKLEESLGLRRGRNRNS